MLKISFLVGRGSRWERYFYRRKSETRLNRKQGNVLEWVLQMVISCWELLVIVLKRKVARNSWKESRGQKEFE